jgi:hypothetical protein
MYFGYFHRRSGLSLMHSPDLEDMRRAIGGEDQDGPDGGSPHVRPLVRPERTSKRTRS